MNESVKTAQRLIAALDELVTQESVVIRTMDFSAAVELRERAAPIVEKLCALAADPLVAGLRPRLDGLLERGTQNSQFLDAQLARMQDELNRVGEAHGRLRRVAPAYKTGRAAAGESRLNAAA